MKSRHIRLIVEYDGTPFVGWQAQPGLPTVQGTLTDALVRITGEPHLSLACAGRTDAGVHAWGQVVCLRTACSKEARRYAPALNRLLPESITIHRAEDVPEDFDPRASARSKRYRYRIYEGPNPSALLRRRAWHVRRRLNLEAMREAATHLIGELDFESFRSSGCDAAHAVRRMIAIDITDKARPPVGRTIDVELHANAFCRHMCRILAGTLCEVGAGMRAATSVQDTLLARSRPRAGVTAPPWGLTLMQVLY